MITVPESDRALVMAGLIRRTELDPSKQRKQLHGLVLLLKLYAGFDLGFTFALRCGVPWSPALDVELDDLTEDDRPTIILPRIISDRLDDALELLASPVGTSPADWIPLIAAVAQLVPQFGPDCTEAMLAERLVASPGRIRQAIEWHRANPASGPHLLLQPSNTVSTGNPSDVANISRALDQVAELARELGYDLTFTIGRTPRYDFEITPAVAQFAAVTALPNNVFVLPLGVAV